MLDIDNFVHFDNDVLIYKSFNELQNEFSKEKSSLPNDQVSQDNSDLDDEIPF